MTYKLYHKYIYSIILLHPNDNIHFILTKDNISSIKRNVDSLFSLTGDFDKTINCEELCIMIEKGDYVITFNSLPFFDNKNYFIIYIHSNNKSVNTKNISNLITTSTLSNCYEKNTYIISNLLKTPHLSIYQAIKHINLITHRLNNRYSNDYVLSREILMSLILTKINDGEYFEVPHITPPIFISKSIAIVGNSKKLLNKKYGKSIDAHKNIIRFNYGITDTYEKHVGSRGNIRLGNIYALQGKPYPGHVKGLIKDYKMYNKMQDDKIIIYNTNHLTEKQLIGNARLNKIPKNKSLHSIIWKKDIFSSIASKYNINLQKNVQCGTGFILLITDLGIVPNIYGFDLEISNDNLGYYWSGSIKQKYRSPHHVISQEHYILKKMINTNKIKSFN